MDHHDWLARWERNNIRFHLPTVNPLLEAHWPKLNIAKSSQVLVPLCGKTQDLLWLVNQGYYVIGVELSEIACEAFFNENELQFSRSVQRNFICYESGTIKLYCGDFFNLSSEVLPPIHAIYDRAALIAVPVDLRRRYVNQLMQLMAPHSQGLLIILDSPDQVQGPPYPITQDEVKRLLDGGFKIQELERMKETNMPKNFQDKGYRTLDEVVYGLLKKPA